MDAVTMDLESTTGTESPYVMLSRATSLAGVYILRPFKQKVIQRRPSQDVREEFRRMDMLYHQTIMRHGTVAEAAEAQRYLLDSFSAQALPDLDETVEESKGDDARQLRHMQRMNSRLIAEASPQRDQLPPSTSPNTRRRTRIVRLPMMEVDSDSASPSKKRALPEGGPESVAKRRHRERIKRRYFR
ncbi:hypothetical protein DFH07DRAFT_965749 [Mycena maculata]|uniref:Uncharacterized protein n=1 Tax=Mycena maculata TaxID=230809 RepID=A0AAD7IDJ4_9AGAR|nr:hypothetical protein DFH07DRAFT_965749 [Mycena maculata]